MIKNRYLKQSVVAAGVIATLSLTGCNVSEDEFAEFLQTTDERPLIETCQDNRVDCMDLLSQEKFRALLSESQVTAL